MGFRFLNEYNSVVEEILDRYPVLRKRGNGRDRSIKLLHEEYGQELSDEDDRSYVLVALALALCRKTELTQPIRDEALQAVGQLREQVPNRNKAFDKLLAYLSEDRIGPEAIYRSRKIYDPQWRIGDTFIHAFSQPAAEKAGLSGWYVVFRKVGEYVDQEDHHMQLVYVTLCPPASIPKTDEELRSLGYLRVMLHDHGWDYLVQLYFKSRKDEEKWQLQKIGCFPDAGSPADATVEDPLVSMPFFGALHRNTDELAYENQVCSLYKLRGIGRGL